MATARRLGEMGRVVVAMDEHELPARLDELDRISPAQAIGPYAQPSLIEAIAQVVFGPTRPR
ncbi:MAG: hypothetical protein KatS3mg103_0384 [Phycisphaerales bacterium]|nr:MAG: hypothetical protein KatS3mg103_0384 [Phycisphaerales bacterium]